MTDHKVFISTRASKDQKDVPGTAKYWIGSAYCKCGWDTAIGLEHSTKDELGVFERSMRHLAEHDSVGRFEYNGMHDLSKTWKRSVAWLTYEQAHEWGILKGEEHGS